MPTPPPRALLSLWNDIAPARSAEYDLWHTVEHVPERVWVPGFVSGTRYLADAPGQPRYFTLYELEDLDCLRSSAYQDLVDRPTPWSASMRPSFANFLRKTGPVAAQAGSVLGAGLVVLRWVWPEAAAPGAAGLQPVAQQMLRAGTAQGATRVRLQRVQAAGAQAMGNVDAAPPGSECIALVETYDPGAAEALAATLAAVEQACWRTPAAWRSLQRYRFASQVRHGDVAAPARPAPRLDLMPPS